MAKDRTEAKIQEMGDAITQAARVLIGAVRSTEHFEGSRASRTELVLEIGLTRGGTETWTITIERTASSH